MESGRPLTIEGKRLLLLAATTGYQTRVFAEAARSLELELVMATDRCHNLDDPWGDQAIAVRFEQPEKSAEVLAEHGPFDGIVAVGDRPTHLAAVAAARLGIPYNSPESVLASRNKYLARERFQSAGLPVPSYFRVRLGEDAREAARRAPYPCVLKPLGLSGSRGVIRADDEAGFLDAFARIRTLLERPEIRRLRDDADRYLQVETFIPGREFALEGILSEGRLQPFALFDKPDPLDGPYFEETIYVTPSREPAAVQAAILGATRQAVQALGLTRGPVHAEMRYNEQGVWMLEVAARPIGGLCSRAVRFRPGTPLEELILRHALGEDVSAARFEGPASGVMMIPIPSDGIYTSVDGLSRAESTPGVDAVIITAKPGQKLERLPEGSSYLGFIFARGGSAADVEQALRNAHRELRFELMAALPVTR